MHTPFIKRLKIDFFPLRQKNEAASIVDTAQAKLNKNLKSVLQRERERERDKYRLFLH